MTQATIPRRTKVNKALVESIGHPLGYAILRVLGERGRASGKELAAAVSKPRSTIGDQLRRLQAGGLIESVAEVTRRGTVERFYRATPSARWVEDAEMGGLSAEEKQRLGLRTVQSVVADASAALSANMLDRRDDWCLGSLRATVDARGWEELSEIHRRALEEVERVRRESAERMAGTDGEALRAFSALMLLELPPSA
jgi:DNA-binding transcriptional ArsR family regulator